MRSGVSAGLISAGRGFGATCASRPGPASTPPSRKGSGSASALLNGFRLSVLSLLLLAAVACGQAVCSVCGEALQGRYLQAGGRIYCSPECHRTTLPQCAACGKRIEGEHFVQGKQRFCSDACLRTVLPTCAVCGTPLHEAFRIGDRMYCKVHADGPRCDACARPVGKGQTLDDGRVVCSECRPALVFEPKPAARLYAQAGRALALALGQPLPAAPPLELVGRDTLPAHGGLDPTVTVRELGRYLRSSETTTTRNVLGMVLYERTQVSRRVLILYGLSRDRFICTAVHELMHDLLSERYPAFDTAPGWATEGVCQYAAALVCRRLGYTARVEEIETADDPLYGAGYRYLARRFGTAGWTQLSRWLDAGDFAALPIQAPEVPWR